MRRLCGWARVASIPSEATFSRAFAACAETALPERMHAVLVEAAFAGPLMGPLVGPIARDSTAIEAREKPKPKVKTPKKKRGKRG